MNTHSTSEQNPQDIADALQSGAIVVVRTDTLYGVIALASNQQAVERVYKVKGRAHSKACIVLLSSPSEAPSQADILTQYSADGDSPTSIIIPATSEPLWVTRGGNSVAYRIVNNEFLRQVIERSGPVIAPSANPEGLPPAQTIHEARVYFGDAVDVYVDGGTVPGEVQASRVIQVNDSGVITRLR